MEAVRLRIADKYFFDNAELLLPSIKDAAGGLLEDGVNAWLTQIYNLTPKTHKDIIESKTVHDFKFCSCGSCAVDGGHDYLRRCGNREDWEELCEVEKLEDNGALA